MAPVDVYAVLGSDRSASWQELRRHYRARARELHPDVQIHRQGRQRLDPQRATQLFSQLQAAWALVATPELRAEYDRATTMVPPAPAPRRPARVPRWRFGPAAAVLLRAGPGDLHIAIPGGDWDLSLARFAGMVAEGAAPDLLIGDIPPHLEVRHALQGLAFVERLRLTTMIGLIDPVQDRGPQEESQLESGSWKLEQLSRAMTHWSRAQPARARQLPYAEELLFMGRLSLAGYQLNVPHPAGLYACAEPRPLSRAEALERRGQSTVELSLPAPTLMLAAFWSGDIGLWDELAGHHRGGPGLAPGADRGGIAGLHALAGKRARADRHEPLSGSVLDRPSALPESLVELRRFPDAWEWLTERRRLPDELPWGAPLSLSGQDQSLSDAGARLTTRLAAQLLAAAPPEIRLVSLNGPRLHLRVPESRLGEVTGMLRSAVADAVEMTLGRRIEPAIR